MRCMAILAIRHQLGTGVIQKSADRLLNFTYVRDISQLCSRPVYLLCPSLFFLTTCIWLPPSIHFIILKAFICTSTRRWQIFYNYRLYFKQIYGKYMEAFVNVCFFWANEIAIFWLHKFLSCKYNSIDWILKSHKYWFYHCVYI